MTSKKIEKLKNWRTCSVTSAIHFRATDQMSNASTPSRLALIKKLLTESNPTTPHNHDGGIHPLRAENARYHILGSTETEA